MSGDMGDPPGREEKSVQTLRRERELERLPNRKRTPPLGSPFSTKLTGVSYAPGYPQVLLDLAEVHAHNRPQWLELRREPDNEHDSNAIAVWWDGHRLGHLNKVIAFRMAPEIDSGTEWLCRVEEVAGSDDLIGCSIRCKRQED